MLEKLINSENPFFSKRFVGAVFLKYFGFFKVPMIGFVKPSIVSFDDDKVVVKIPLGRRSKNHLNCMYFGCLATGADLAGGIAAIDLIYRNHYPVSFLFKDMKADFLKRAEGDTFFSCYELTKVKAAVVEAVKTGTRINIPFEVIATVPSKLGDDPVAKFVLTLSLKKLPAKK